MAQSGGVFMILGIAFIAIGLSGQRTFLWIGVSFLVTGIACLALSRKQTPSNNDDKNEQQESIDNDN